MSTYRKRRADDSLNSNGNTEDHVGASKRRRSEGRYVSSRSSSAEIEVSTSSIPSHENQLRSKRPGLGAENGIIEAITCTNFMCHSHLHVELGPLINFVIGHNGSGKSAVLTALTICLGGKASSTNRGSTLKAFIKEGQDSSTLTVRIKNANGYHQEIYGESILVERIFNRAGASSFKIKSGSGKVVSTTKSTLDEVLDFYALQLDNPICVLSQDMARQFLHNSTASDKYKFFIKGVQLEQMNQDYDLLSENIDTIEQTFERKEDNLKMLRNKDQEAKKRLSLLERQDQINDEIRNLSAQMAWAQVEDQESKLSGVRKLFEEAKLAVEKATTNVHDVTKSFDDAQKAIQIAEELVNSVSQERHPIEKDLENAISTHAEAGKGLETARLEQRKVREDIQRSKEREVRLRRNIEEEEGKLAEASGPAASGRLEAVKQCQTAFDHVREELNEKRKVSKDSISREVAAKSEWDHAQNRLKLKLDEASQAKQHLLNLRTSGSRQDYPRNMDQLLRTVHEETRFRNRPVGPLGDYLSLTTPLWATVLEKTFGSVLDSFIVTSKADRDCLNALMKQCECICPIHIQAKSARLDISAQEPAIELDTIARVLKVSNDLVFNFLIINQRIEQILLIEDEGEATQLLASQRPRNVKACYTRDQRNPTVAHNIQNGVSGPTSTFIDLRNVRRRIQANIRDQAEAQEVVINHLENEKRGLERLCFRYRGEYEEFIKVKNRQNKEIDSLCSKVESSLEALNRAEEAMNRGTVEEGKLAALQEALRNVHEEAAGHEESMASNLHCVSKAKEALRVKDMARKIVENRMKDVDLRLGKASTSLEKAKDNRYKALQTKNEAHKELERLIESLEQCKADEKAQADVVEDYARQAGNIHSRCVVPEGETTSSLDRRLEILVEQVERYRQDIGGDRAKLARDYSESHACYENFKMAFEAEKDLLNLLKRTLGERQERWRLFRKHIAARAKTKFMYLLSERSFRGQLLVDHNKRLMDLRVQPNSAEARSAARQTRTLSGGEKSFSTICLLLALWEAIGAPVRCLDEFDVFMDNANRDVSMRLLISAARGAHDRQFIFITPQSMSSIDRCNDVKIIKMRDPERGQTILSVSRAR